MKYERLTDKQHRYKKCVDCKYRNCQYCDNDIEYANEVHNRLAELEDKFEQGTLIELPCKVGDTVCKYYSNGNAIKIMSGTVSKIEMRKNGILFYITTLPSFYYDKDLIGDLSKGFIDTTCYYFCPVEEAEKRLKELQE